MKKEKDVREGLYSLFRSLVKRGVTDEFFVRKLKSLCHGSRGKTFWWRYHSNDGLANTPLLTELFIRGKVNRRSRVSTLQDMQYAIDNESLILFYS